jgi:hypothetical protein
LVASKSSIVAERFFRKPDLQLRAFGASAPDVSFNKNVSSSFARHPVIVTEVTVWTATFDLDSAAAFGVDELDTGSIAMALTDSTAVVFSIDASAAADLADTPAVAGDFGATGFFVSSRAAAAACSGSTIASGGTIASGSAIAFGGALMLVTSARSDGWRAAINTATAKTPITPSRIARGLVDRAGTEVARTGTESVVRVDFFARIVGVGFFALFAFFAGTGILLSESLWSFRSALSTYRIDRGGFVDPFTRTDVLLR